MSVTSGFFDSKNKDRLYNTEQLSSIFDGIIKDGVYMGYEDAFIVKATDPASLTVNVGPGRAWFHHTWTHNDAPLPIVVKQGDVVLDRIDSIIIDIDKTEDVRSNKVTYLEGSPSSEPTAPVLVNEEKHWQIPLCDISMPAGSTTITQAQITNRIGTSDCPFVTGIIETIDTDELLAQWNAEYREWYERVQQEIDQWTEQEQEDFTNWMNGRKTEFDEWFAGIQDILDGDTAGNLLNRINHRTGINATATYSAGVVAITAPDDAGEILTFVAPSDFLSSDTYTLNGEALTITDLNGEALEEAWKKNSPITITVSGGKAFFKSGGGAGKLPSDLAPLCPNFKVERSGTKVKISADKIQLNSYTNMVAGGVWAWGKTRPTKPTGENTKLWSRAELITTSKPKPYDGLYLGDVTPSDAVSEVLLWLPENKDGKVVLIPFIILSVDYLGGVYVVRKFVWAASAFGVYGVDSYDGSTLDAFIMQSYANSVISDEILNEIVEVDYSIYSVSLSTNKTVKRKVITVSAGECNMGGFSDGNKIQRFSTPANRIAYDESGQARAYWTRTKNNDSVSIGVNTSGNFGGYTSTSSQYTRPSFVLPKDFKVQKRPDGSYTVWTGESGLTWSNLMVSDEVTETIVNILEPKTGMVPTIYLSDDFNESDALLLLRRDVLNVTAIGNRYTSGGAVDQYSKRNTYAKIQSWAENDVDPKIIAKKVLTTIKQRSVYYDGGQDKNVYAITSCEAYAFELGNDELGFSAFSEGVCGTKLPYFSSDTRRIAKLDANIKSYNTRDAAVRPLASADTWYVVTEGGARASTKSAVNVRPSILISKDVWFNKLADGSYDLIPEDPALATQTVSTLAEAGTYTFIGDSPTPTEQPLEIEIEWPKSDPLIARQWIYNEKGVHQTMLLGGVASTEDAPTFELPIFTGNHMIYGDETEGRIELLESGELTLYPGTYDVFVAGAGASGSGNASPMPTGLAPGGAGSGYTITKKGITVKDFLVLSVLVGAGGVATTSPIGSTGSKSSITIGEDEITANGGNPAAVYNYYYTKGGDGGSGGGGNANNDQDGGAVGTDGSNGSSGGGTGQGTTTRAFEDPEGTLYATGGRAGGTYNKTQPGTSATANTADGGSSAGMRSSSSAKVGGNGGSGIIIIRWNNAA